MARFLVLVALLLVIAVQTHSQQFNTYDPSEGSPRPLPPSIPGAFPVPGDRPRPSFRPQGRRIQAPEDQAPLAQSQPQAPPPGRPKFLRRPFQARAGRISPLDAESEQKSGAPVPFAPSPFPPQGRPLPDGPFAPQRPVVEEDDEPEAQDPTLPAVTVTQRQPLFRPPPQQPALPVFRQPASVGFAPTPFIIQEEGDSFVPAKQFKPAAPPVSLNEGGQQGPQRKAQFRPQGPNAGVRQQTSKAPQYEKPARPLQPTATAERNDIDRAGYREKKPVAQILKRYREDNPDGSITWGFENDDGSFKEETIGIDCVTRGKYGYIDPDGNRREYSYTSGIPCNRNKEQDEEASDTNGYIDYTNNRYVMPNGDSIDLSSMVKNRARKPVKNHQYS